MKNNLFLLFLIGVLLGTPQRSWAQSDTNYLDTPSWDRFSIHLGGFLASYNSGVKIASKQVGLGVLVDVEDILGIRSATFAFRGEAKYRFSKKRKQSLTFGYFGIFRNGSKTLDEELEIGDQVFPIGATIQTKFNFSILRAKYDYTFFEDNRVSLGASFGLFVVPLTLGVKSISYDDHQTRFTAPLPLIGLRSDFRISNKFYLNQSVEFLYLSFSKYTGSILDLKIALEHKSFKNVAFGLGINSNRLTINIEKEDSPIDFYGDIGMDYSGVFLYAKYFF